MSSKSTISDYDIDDCDLNTDTDVECEPDGIFRSMLEDVYYSTVHEDVVRLKRKKIKNKLCTVENALQKNDYMSAYVFLVDIHQMIDDDPYQDEYELLGPDLDIVNFSACIMAVLSKLYGEAKNLISDTAILGNPVFTYMFGLLYVYQLNFKKAAKYVEEALSMLNAYEDDAHIFFDVDVNVFVTDITAKDLKSKFLFALYAISIMKDVQIDPDYPDEARRNSEEDELINQAKQLASSYKEVTLGINKKTIGRMLHNDIYSMIRTNVNNLINFDFSNLPVKYKRSVLNVVKTNFKMNQLQFKSELLQDDAWTKSGDRQDKMKGKKSVQLRHKLVQTNFPMKNVQTQAGFKNCSHSTQTTEVSSVAETFELKKMSEDLKTKLDRALEKQANADFALQNLRAKVKELENKLKQADDFFLTHQQQWEIQEQEYNIKNEKLQDQIEVLQENNAILNYKLSDSNERLNSCRNLLVKEYEDGYNIQMTFYKGFELKCIKMISMLFNLKQKVSETSSPTMTQCEDHMTDWSRVSLDCTKRRSEVANYYKAVKVLLDANQLCKIGDLPALPPFLREPPNFFFEHYPNVVVNLVESQKQLEGYEKIKTAQTTWEYQLENTWAHKMSGKSLTNTWDDKLFADRLKMLRGDKLIKAPTEAESNSKSFNENGISSATIESRTSANNTLAKEVGSKRSSVKTDSTRTSAPATNGIALAKPVDGTSESVNLKYESASGYRHYQLNNVVSAASSKMSGSSCGSAATSASDCSALTGWNAHLEHTLESDKTKRLYAFLREKITTKSPDEILSALNVFRNQNNGKLTGMTYSFILYNVYKILDTHQSAWAVVKSNFVEWKSDSEESNCSICFDPFKDAETTQLQCKHRFHTQCIRKWLSTNSICAICRIHVTMDEDFPPLKA